MNDTNGVAFWIDGHKRGISSRWPVGRHAASSFSMPTLA